MQIFTAVNTLTFTLVVTHATPLNVYNQCSESIQFYDNSATETIAPGGSTTRTLTAGFNGMFRNSVGSQATLAELSITGGFTWYDISIIPTGTTGPGNCGSLEACKALTGGTGFNTAMQIAPSGCTTVTCMADGCTDAYLYPSDGGKTHSCPDTATIDLLFCPGGSGATAATSSAAPRSVPKTSAPTTAAPTAAPTQASLSLPTRASKTAAPTPERTTATPLPTSSAPTVEPATETSEPVVTEIPEQLVASSSSSLFSNADSFNSSSSSLLDKVLPTTPPCR